MSVKKNESPTSSGRQAAAQGAAAEPMPLFSLLEEEVSLTKHREDWCSIARGISVLVAFTAGELMNGNMSEQEAE